MDYHKPCQACQGHLFTRLFTKHQFRILRCQHCGLVFTDIPPGFDLNAIYDETYFAGGQDDGYADYLASEKVLRKEFKQTVKFIKRFSSGRQRQRLLEVGSAYGFFLDEASPYFECTGIEVSESGAEFSRKRGHHVVSGVADNLTIGSLGTFDIIVMLDVLEHLPEPQETLKLLSGKLNPSGLLLIVTGDVDSTLSRLAGRNWRLMTPPQHTFFFSKETLNTMINNADMELLNVSKPWKFVPLGLMLYQLTSRMGIRMKAIRKLNGIGFYVNLFDTVRILAKKK